MLGAELMGRPATFMARQVRAGQEGLPFPESLCHRCAAPPRYIRTANSIFIRCPLLVDKYPPQPVLSCPLFRPAEGIQGNGWKTDGDDSMGENG